jgi:hypothetical protein
MWCDAQRRVVERCDVHVAYRDVDVLRIYRLLSHGLSRGRLQDSSAAVIAVSFGRAEKPRLEWDVTKPVTVGFGVDGYQGN